METINALNEKLELDYPCAWRYKIVGVDADTIETAILEVIVTGREYTLSASNVSRSGKYVSLNLDLLVHNEEERQFIYESLKAHGHVKMVL